ncbi:ATP-binding protein [Megamonas sp.]
MKKCDLYLNKLIKFKDKQFIKVITGIRCCGKSTLLKLFRRYLLENDVSEKQIIYINFESMQFDDIKDYKLLYEYIKEHIAKDSRTYLLLDEIQEVIHWEKAVNSFLVDFNVDIYITGSNAWLLSSELSTLLSGRYIEIKMLPLSFKEYMDFIEKPYSDRDKDFQSYLRYGGLPPIIELNNNFDMIQPFLSGIYNTVLMKDIVQRNTVRDPALLDNLVRFLADNIGNSISTKKISDYLTSAGRKTTPATIDNYLQMLEKAFIFYKVNRYDIKGKLYLKTQEKYYIVDTGIRNNLLGLRNMDYDCILENVVYLELLRRGFDVYIGKIGSMEVDFIAVKANRKIYYQVSASILDEKTKGRELRSLMSIPDQYDKILLTMDKPYVEDFEGIKWMNIIDFLLEDTSH